MTIPYDSHSKAKSGTNWHPRPSCYPDHTMEYITHTEQRELPPDQTNQVKQYTITQTHTNINTIAQMRHTTNKRSTKSKTWSNTRQNDRGPVVPLSENTITHLIKSRHPQYRRTHSVYTNAAKARKDGTQDNWQNSPEDPSITTHTTRD